MTSQQRTETKRPNSWLDHIPQSGQINGQQGVGSRRRSLPLFDVSTFWFKYEELIDDLLDFTVFEAEKRGPALKNRLLGDAAMYEGLLDSESLRAASISGIRWDTTSSKELRVCSSGDFLSSPEREGETSRWPSGSASYHCF